MPIPCNIYPSEILAYELLISPLLPSREQPVLLQLGPGAAGSGHLLTRSLLPPASCGELQTQGWWAGERNQ